MEHRRDAQRALQRLQNMIGALPASTEHYRQLRNGRLDALRAAERADIEVSMNGTSGQLVSVILPAYNAVKFVRRALDSVLAQTHAKLEVIVVDDGSDDATDAAVEAVMREDSRVRLHRHPQNMGVSAARNTALAMAKGDYIATIDADDLWHPTKLEKQLSIFFNSNPQIGVVYCWSSVIDEDDKVIFPRKVYHTPVGYVYPHLILGNIIGNGSAPVVRRSLLLEIGGYDLAFSKGSEDHKLYLALAERCEFGLVPEFLVGYRRTRNSLSSNVAAVGETIKLLTQEIQLRHPNLPNRLFRWRNGNMYRYLALHSRMKGAYGNAALLACKVAVTDPLLVVNALASKVMRRLQPISAEANQQEEAPNFFSMPPEPREFEQYRAGIIERRRQSFAATVRIKPSDRRGLAG